DQRARDRLERRAVRAHRRATLERGAEAPRADTLMALSAGTRLGRTKSSYALGASGMRVLSRASGEGRMNRRERISRCRLDSSLERDEPPRHLHDFRPAFVDPLGPS